MKAAIFYWTKTKNTEKVAHTIKKTLEENGYNVLFKKINDVSKKGQILNKFEKFYEINIFNKTSVEIDYFDYNLVCIGFPSYSWHPPPAIVSFLKKMHHKYQKRNLIKYKAPEVQGKNALIFCTYSGVHTGINEAVPAGKYVGQFFEHIGFNILDELYILGEFHGSIKNSTLGRMGDIRGRPNHEDLSKVKNNVINLLKIESSSRTLL